MSDCVSYFLGVSLFENKNSAVGEIGDGGHTVLPGVGRDAY